MKRFGCEGNRKRSKFECNRLIYNIYQQASRSLTSATALSRLEKAEDELNAGRKRALRQLEIKGECRRVPRKRNCVDDGICDTPGKNDIRKSETKQRTKTKAMQQSIFPRRVRLVVIEEPFVEISHQCHESYAVEHAKAQENKRKRTRVTVEAEPGTRHKNQRCRGKGHHDLRYVHVALVAMLKGHGFAKRVGRSECRGKTVPYFDGIHSDTPPNKGENSQAS